MCTAKKHALHMESRQSSQKWYAVRPRQPSHITGSCTGFASSSTWSNTSPTEGGGSAAESDNEEAEKRGTNGTGRRKCGTTGALAMGGGKGLR